MTGPSPRQGSWNSFTLRLLAREYAVCRLPAEAIVPEWAWGGGVCSVTRAPGELSVVCEESRVPEGVQAERGWRCLHVQGPLDFGLTGVIASIVNPLSAAGVPIFVLSTYDTDLILVRAVCLSGAAAALRESGHLLLEE